jgi:nucleoside-diphosphate-sugar epimerase
MNCLVTGSTGYIGSNLTKRLLHDKHHVIGLIHQRQPNNEHIPNLRYIQADITDLNALDTALSHTVIDIVFHCAAYVKDYGKKKDFYTINYMGTKNLVTISKKLGISRFIYLGHIPTSLKHDYYSTTKHLAEHYLLHQYTEHNFPVVIIRPGNVFGPGRNLWVGRVLKTIQRNKITLIDNGSGIFHHTYIDNLLDALTAAMIKPKALGNILPVTDDDNSITWGEYLNFLSQLVQNKDIPRSMSKHSAYILSRMSMIFYHIFGLKPIITPLVVYIFSNKSNINIDKTKEILDYQPKVGYDEAIKNIEQWLKKERLTA